MHNAHDPYNLQQDWKKRFGTRITVVSIIVHKLLERKCLLHTNSPLGGEFVLACHAAQCLQKTLLACGRYIGTICLVDLILWTGTGCFMFRRPARCSEDSGEIQCYWESDIVVAFYWWRFIQCGQIEPILDVMLGGGVGTGSSVAVSTYRRKCMYVFGSRHLSMYRGTASFIAMEKALRGPVSQIRLGCLTSQISYN